MARTLPSRYSAAVKFVDDGASFRQRRQKELYERERNAKSRFIEWYIRIGLVAIGIAWASISAILIAIVLGAVGVLIFL